MTFGSCAGPKMRPQGPAMRLANAHGDDLGVLRAYQRCEKVPGEIDADPIATRQFVGQLRR